MPIGCDERDLSRSHLVRMAFAALLLLAVAPFLSAAGDNQVDARAAVKTSAIAMPAEWRAHTQQWLNASQIRDRDLVAYGEISELYLGAKPDLYSTAWILQIADGLRWPLTRDRKKAIGVWIESLRNHDGFFRDPLGRFPDLYSTLLASQALKTVGVGIKHAPALRARLLAMQGPDGLFYDPAAPAEGPRALENALATTDTVLEIFHATGEFPAQTSVTRQRLFELGARKELFAFDSPEAILQQGGLVLNSLRLLGLQPDEGMSANPMWKDWTRHWLDQLLQHNVAVDGPTVSAVSRLLAIADFLDIDVGGDGEIFRRALTDAQLANGGYGLSRGMRSMEPQVTAVVIDLFRRLRRDYPRPEVLATTLRAYQVAQGWRSIVEHRPDLRATFYAAGIGSELGLELPVREMARYLQEMQDRLASEQDPSSIVSATYYLAATYRRLGLDPPRMAEFRDRVERAMAALTLAPEPLAIEAVGHGMAALILMGGELAPGERERFRHHLASLRKPDGGFGTAGQQSDVRVTYHVLLAANALGIPDIGDQATTGWLRSLQAPDGGFLRYTGYPFADMDATYHAVAALALSRASSGDAAQVQAFIARARFPAFGFSAIPTDSPFMKGFSGVPADLRTTYGALAILAVLRGENGWLFPP